MATAKSNLPDFKPVRAAYKEARQKLLEFVCQACVKLTPEEFDQWAMTNLRHLVSTDEEYEELTGYARGVADKPLSRPSKYHGRRRA